MDSEKLKGLSKVHIVKKREYHPIKQSTKFRRDRDNFDYGTFSAFQSRAGVYAIINTKTFRYYIGSSNNIGRRLQKHFSELRFNRHTNKRLQEDFNEFGIEIFSWHIIEETSDNLADKERHYQIRAGIDNLYNEKITNYYLSDELRKILANTDKSTHKTQEYRDKMSLLKSHGIVQYDKQGNLITVYDNMNDVISKNPTFKGQPIRGVCNGSKRTAYGYIWRYINNDGSVKELKDKI